jgi:hypothetical protein
VKRFGECAASEHPGQVATIGSGSVDVAAGIDVTGGDRLGGSGDQLAIWKFAS